MNETAEMIRNDLKEAQKEFEQWTNGRIDDAEYSGRLAQVAESLLALAREVERKAL